MKQATPLRREPSSEYFRNGNATGNGTPSRSSRNLETVIADVETATGNALKNLVPDEARKEGGAMQFLIAVGGIYGSL